MKKSILLYFLVLLPVVALAGETVKVKVKTSSLFAQPKFFAKVVAAVKYGDQLEMIDERGDWVYVQRGGHKGWIHKSALTSTKVNLGTILVGTSSPDTTEDEVALAGKGFTPEIEQGYKQSHPEMNYALVDKIESYRVDPRSFYDFIKRGDLRVGEETP